MRNDKLMLPENTLRENACVKKHSCGVISPDEIAWTPSAPIICMCFHRKWNGLLIFVWVTLHRVPYFTVTTLVLINTEVPALIIQNRSVKPPCRCKTQTKNKKHDDMRNKRHNFPDLCYNPSIPWFRLLSLIQQHVILILPIVISIKWGCGTLHNSTVIDFTWAPN